MAPPLITRSTRYTSQGITRCYFLATIAATTFIPTRTEINAGTDLTPEIADWAGFSVTSALLPAPDLSTRYESQIAGKITAVASTITFYASSNGIDVRGVLPRDTAGFVVMMDGGDVAGRKMSIYPVTVTSDSMDRSAQAANPDRVVVSFAITNVPAELVTVP